MLNSFYFSRAGETIQITDEDGSVYSGQVNPDANAAVKAKLDLASGSQVRLAGENRLEESLAPAQTPASLVTGTSPVKFRASGTNITLGKMVVFDGSFITAPGNQPPLGQDRYVTRPRSRSNASGVSGPAPLILPATTTPSASAPATSPERSVTLQLETPARPSAPLSLIQIEGQVRVNGGSERLIKAVSVTPQR